MNNMKEYLTFSGHLSVKANHKTTLEVTKAITLSEKGDCIIGVKSSKSCKDLNEDFKKMLSDNLTKVIITIQVNNEQFVIHAMGHSALTLSHPEDIVIRKSSFVCNRTLAIKADKAAIDIPHNIVSALKCEGLEYSMGIMLEK